jgi:putative oxidoreductase
MALFGLEAPRESGFPVARRRNRATFRKPHKKMKLTRIFAPEHNSRIADLSLLTLRIWLGSTMLVIHGWPKLSNFGQYAEKFPDVFGLGSTASLALATFAEAFCSVLLIFGAITRFAALMLAFTMLVAFGVGHQFALTGANPGELAFIYMAGFVTILLAGPGRYSMDAAMFSRGTRP